MKFESEDGGTTVECAYDSMGRRFEKKVTVGGTTGFHARYLYRDYLQVAECDLTGETPDSCASYIWDPSKPTAVRILTVTGREANGMLSEGAFLLRARDDEKLYLPLRGRVYGRRALYEYQPYGGLITSEGNMGGRKRVSLLERIHGWRTGTGLSQCLSVSIRLISLEQPHPCWKSANGGWKEIGIHAELVL